MKLLKILTLSTAIASSCLAAAESTMENQETIQITLTEEPSPSHNPLILAREAAASQLPESAAFLAAGVPFTITAATSLIPGGTFVAQGMQFYYSTEADIPLGDGTLSRAFGDNVRSIIERAPGGGYLLTLVDYIKPAGATSLTEAVMNTVIGDVATTRIDQGFICATRSLAVNAIKQFTPFGIGRAMVIGYTWLKGKIWATPEATHESIPPHEETEDGFIMIEE